MTKFSLRFGGSIVLSIALFLTIMIHRPSISKEEENDSSNDSIVLLSDEKIFEVADIYETVFDDYFGGHKTYEESIGKIVSDKDFTFHENSVLLKGSLALKEYYEASWKPAFMSYKLNVVHRFRAFGTNIVSYYMLNSAELIVDCSVTDVTEVHKIELDSEGKIIEMHHYYGLNAESLECIGKLQAAAAEGEGEESKKKEEF